MRNKDLNRRGFLNHVGAIKNIEKDKNKFFKVANIDRMAEHCADGQYCSRGNTLIKMAKLLRKNMDEYNNLKKRVSILEIKEE